MILVGQVMVSDLVVETRFCCRLEACRGCCCQDGERGSPLRRDEVEAITAILPTLLPRLPADRREDIETSGFFLREGGSYELRCLPDGRCIFAAVPAPLAPLTCMIELAWHDKVVDFRKPRFCHLFPLRTEDFYGRRCLNLERRPECTDAFDEGPLVVDFCREALIREFGEPWYDELLVAVKRERRRRKLR